MAKSENICPPARLSAVLATANDNVGRALGELDALLADYPRDARLHFLKGSFQAGAGDFAAARVAMRHAVDLQPDFAVARFQLGFLLLTSGEPIAAQEAWGPLHSLPDGHHLRFFVDGLTHLIGNQFSDAIRCLEEGMVRNTENPPMNKDMQRIIDEIRARKLESEGGSTAPSAVDFLLQQSIIKSTRH